MRFRDYILERYTPSVLVLSTPEIEDQCKNKNGLSIVDLLRPFGYFQHLSVPVRIVGEQAYRIKEFRLRFYEQENMVQPSLEAAAGHLKEVLTSTTATSGIEPDVDLLAALRKGGLPEQTPWFEDFRREYLRMLAFSDLDTFDQPVACLFVGHSHAEDVLTMFEELRKSPLLSPAVRTGMTDGRIARHYLLLHDTDLKPPGGMPWAEEKLRALRSRLGEKACHLVQLNTRDKDSRDAGFDNLFKAHRQSVVPGGGAGEPQHQPDTPPEGLGGLLSNADLSRLSAFLVEFSVRSLLPHLEARVRLLYHQVMATRKGVRNQLKNLLWRSKSSASELPDGVQGSQSPEAQLRALADLAFLIQDYETSLSTLRLLAADLKSDKEWRHYAAVQEMQGLAAFMAGYSAGEVISCFRDAFNRYDSLAGRSNKNVRRYATRSQLLLAEFCCQQRHFSEANAALMRAQNQVVEDSRNVDRHLASQPTHLILEENLIAAVLLEQAALNLLHLTPPSIRKWAFHLVLAALRFSNCQQPQLANRAYRQVVGVFDARQWGHINCHLHDKLGFHAAEAGDYAAAANHFAETLVCSGTHPTRQKSLFQQFLGNLEKLSPEQLETIAPNMPLPEVDTEHINVSSDDSKTYANAEALSYSETFWRSMAAPLLIGQENSSQSNWLEGGRKSSTTDLNRRTAVSGEEIGMELDVYNPMLSELHVTRLQLAVEASTSGAVQPEEEDITLKGGERMKVRLRFIASQPGILTVKGVSWWLEGAARGYKSLQLRQLPQPRSREASSDLESEPGLSFNIIPGMPRLQASFLNQITVMSSSQTLKDTKPIWMAFRGVCFAVEVEMRGLEGVVLEGELVSCTALLRNVGSLLLQGLRLLISSPDLLCCSSSVFLNKKLTCLEDYSLAEEEGSALATSGLAVKGGGRLYEWPATVQLSPGASMEWPFFFHPQRSGQSTVHCQWYYEAKPVSSTMPWRMLRWSCTLDVLPSLQLQSRLLPSSTGLQSCLLHLAASVPEASQPITILDIASTSPDWGMSAVNGQPLTTSSHSAEGQKVVILRAAHLICQLRAIVETDSDCAEETWMSRGPIAHFHSDRKRPDLVQHSSGEAVTRSLEGSSAKQVVAVGQPKSNLPNEQAGKSFAIAWSTGEGTGFPHRFGVTHLLDCKFQEVDLLRAVVVGQRSHTWDFSRGPVCIQLTLNVQNCKKLTASLCCETGTSLDLKDTDQDRRYSSWRVRVPSDSNNQGKPGSSGSPILSPETPQSSRSVQAGPPSSSSHLWTGKTRASVPHLEAGAVAEVPLQILFFKPGIYQIVDYALFWTFPDGSMNAAKLGPPIQITIDQA